MDAVEMGSLEGQMYYLLYRGCINKTCHFDEDANHRSIKRMEAK